MHDRSPPSADTSPRLSYDFEGYQYWIYHLLATQNEDRSSIVAPTQRQHQQRRSVRQSTPHDVEPDSQPISPTSDSVDMHAMLDGNNLSSPFLAFRPTKYDVPESIVSTHISSSSEAISESTHRPHKSPRRRRRRSLSPSKYNDPHTLRYLSYGMDIDMDLSCLDDMDDQLVYHPSSAFAMCCWTEATQEDIRCPISFSAQRSQLTLGDDNDTDANSFYSDSTATPRAEAWIAAPELPVDEKMILLHAADDDDDGGLMDVKNTRDYFISTFTTNHSPPIQPPKIDGYFTGCDPRDAIHFYPVSPLARELRGRSEWRRNNHGLGRITRFLPRRFPVSAS